MLKHYFKIAIRNIVRNKIYSIINIVGLTLGFSCSFLVLLYVLNETGYNKFNQKRKQIYRVITEYVDSWEQPGSSCIMAPTMKSEFPEIENIARINKVYTPVKKGDEYITERDFLTADNDIFKIFTLPFIKGNPENALVDPFSVVLSESTANKYFENEDALGKILTISLYGQDIELTVTGIMEDIPWNSTTKADLIGTTDLAIKYWEQRFNNKDFTVEWGATYFGQTFILLPKDYNASDLEDKFLAFEEKHLPEGLRMKFHLQALKDIYLRSSHMMNNRGASGNITSIYIFSAIGFLILIIASINYIILSTARSAIRSKEIGIRKVTGANKKTLIRQILGESIFVTFIALPLAIILVHLLLPSVSQLFRKELVLNYSENWQYVVGLLAVTIIIGLISGSYIAFFLSSFSPMDVLKSKINTGSTRAIYRRILVSVQLVIFIVLILGSSVIYRQISFAKNQDMGFNRENLVIIYHNSDEFRKRYESFKNEISSNPDIINVSGAMFSPPTNGGMQWDVKRLDDPSEVVKVEGLAIDFNYIETFEFELIDGRSFSKEFSTDSNAIVLNETAVKDLGIEDPVGKDIDGRTIIGVIKDFHLHSFHQEINPMIIDIMQLKYAREVVMRIQPEKLNETLTFLEEKWKEFAPDAPFEYSFFDDALASLYRGEQRFGKIVSISTFLAILIASLGLFGLSLFIAEQRTKEISIRKVFGSSVMRIIKLISKEFLVLVIIANIIAGPLAFYIMDKWLQNFAYQTKIEFWIYIIAAILSSIIVLATISFQTIKAANSNPASALRYE